jgi:peptidoglycan/xylan/chitin deacetylase (PgdA/CDA1 family)
VENESGSDPGVHLISRRWLVGGAMATTMTAAYGRQAQTARAASAAMTIARGSTSSAVVALTFDCGADSGYTGSILDTLANRGVKASFGVIGKFAASYPALVQRM